MTKKYSRVAMKNRGKGRYRQGGDFCAARNCKNARRKLECVGMSFFGFPTDKERCGVWVENSKRFDLKGKSPAELKKSRFVLCSEHFESSQFNVPSERKRLVWNAVPTLFGVSDEHFTIVTKKNPCQEQIYLPDSFRATTVSNSETMQKQRKEFICSCFFSRNIFIKTYKLHVTYQNDEQFHNDYRQHLRMRGCSTTQQYGEVLIEIQEEVGRRKIFHISALDRHNYILKNYSRLHPHLWQFDPNIMDEKLERLLDNCKRHSSVSLIENTISECGGQVHESRIYQFPVFSKSFCQQLVEELSNFEASPCPKARPNTMNKYGISLDELGISDELLSEVIIRYICPICAVLFEDWSAKTLDSYKAFIVMYGHDKDTELHLHYDNAEMTLNVCLTDEFGGGNLEFGHLWPETDDGKSVTIQHQVGMGMLHRGRQMHKALPTLSGQRCNMIIWMRSSSIRNQCCPMCEQEPSLIEVPFAGDGYIPQGDTTAIKCVTL